MEAYAKETGNPMQLNKWYDCNEEEYFQQTSGVVGALQLDDDAVQYSDILCADPDSKQALYTCSEDEYIALTSGKATVKVVQEEFQYVVDAEFVDPEEALEKAKEDARLAAAEISMDKDEIDRILAKRKADADRKEAEKRGEH